jgi:recombination protein RecA
MAIKRKTKTKAPAKREPLYERIMRTVQKKFGADAAINLGAERDAAAQIREYIPTGVDVIDRYVLGRGGLPVGRISEVYGPEGCGKTSLGYSTLAAAQRAGGVAVMADVEHSFDEERARTFGVNLDELIVLQPKHMEEMFNQMHEVLGAHDPGAGPMLIVWDSIASTSTKEGLEADPGDKTPGVVARLMSEELKKLLVPLHANRAHLMMLNQIRQKFGGSSWGDNTTTPGGNAPKFYASVRLAFFGGKSIKNSLDEHVGKVVTILASKNRLVSPFRKARVRFDYSSGWDNMWSTIEHAKRMKVIDPRADGFKGPGKKGAEAYREALEALDWEPSAPIDDSVEADDSETEASDDGDE